MSGGGFWGVEIFFVFFLINFSLQKSKCGLQGYGGDAEAQEVHQYATEDGV